MARIIKGKKLDKNNVDEKTAMPDKKRKLEIGGHRLEIPKGAVAQATKFTLTEVAGRDYIEVRLQADGQDKYEFQKGYPAVLILSYKERQQDNETTEDLGVFRLKPGDSDVIWYRAPAADDIGHDENNKEVNGSIERFSRYAIGSGRIE